MRGDPITKLGEDFCAIDRRSAADVVLACRETLVAGSLPGLGDIHVLGGSSLVLSASLLAKHVLLYTGRALCLRRPPAVLWFVLRTCFQICTHWLYPTGAKWRRSSAAVEPLWAACACSRTLLWLVGQGFHKWPFKAAQLLSPRHRQFLWRHARPNTWSSSDTRSVMEELVYLQLQAICPTPGAASVFDSQLEKLHALYCWCAPCGYYVGIAGALRKRQRYGAGIVSRWLEHFTALIRNSGAESGRLRYKVMKRVHPDETFFLVCCMGPESRIRAAETLEISTRRPNANVRGPSRAKSQTLAAKQQRQRPPKHVRLACVSGPSEDCLVLERAVAKKAGSFARSVVDSPVGVGAVESVPCLGFDALYVLEIRQKLACSGEHGPLDIYDPIFSSLLATWCGKKGAVILWHVLERKWGVTCGPACVARMVGDLQGQGRKALATKCLNRELGARGLPSVQGVTLRVPRPSLMPSMRETLRQAVWLCPRWSHGEKAWLLSKVRLCAGALGKHRDKWNAVTVSKEVCKEEVATKLQSTEGSEILRGQGMFRVEKVWDVPVRPSFQEDVESVSSATSVACSLLHLPPVVRQFACHEAVRAFPSSQAYKQEQLFFQRTRGDYMSYTHDMTRPSGVALVPDDKEKKMFWKLPRDAYAVLLYHFAIISAAWEMVPLSASDAQAWCKAVMFTLIPAPVQKFLFLRKYRSFLPYYYGTVKAKCFGNGEKKCTKEGHSCLRKVVSFAAWPFRKRWRFIHRGLETVLRRTGIGDEVWSLKDSSRVVDRRMVFACVADGGFCCCRCGCPKDRTVAITADAGQFFESVQARQAIAATRHVIRKCEAMTQKHCVTILRGPKRVAFVGGCVRAKCLKGYVFTFTELFLCFAACMFMCFVTLGNTVFRMKGLPIGGVLSKVAASFVLACEEHAWLCDVAGRRGHGYSSRCLSWDREVARARYVDDVLWISGAYCRACLVHALRLTYSVPFDVEDASPCIAWLDLILDVRSLKWSMKVSKWTLPPPWGAPLGFLHGFLCGRLCRWSEVNLDQSSWVAAAANVVIALRDAQWPRCAVRSAVFKVATKWGRAKRDLLLHVLQATWQ